MPVTTQAFKGWLKSSNNIKFSSDSSALRVTHESITNFVWLSDFDKKSIDNLSSVYKNSVPVIEVDPTNSIASEASFSGANASSMSVSRIITVVNATKHHWLIARVMFPET